MRQTRINALLLAAGHGTRLQPLTNYWPKCLMPIKGYPLISYWLETLSLIDTHKIVINLHHHQDEVIRFFNENVSADKFELYHESKLEGTLGTFISNINHFKNSHTLLIHADNLCRCNFKDFANYHLIDRPSETLLTMLTFNTDDPSSCGIIKKDNKGIVTEFFEKVENPPGTEANGAVYFLSPEFIDILDKDFRWATDFSTEVIPYFLGKIATWVNKDYHRDIGNINSLKRAQVDLFTPLGACFPNKRWQKYFESKNILNH